MAEKNTNYSEVWAAFTEMDARQKETIGVQMFSFLKGASISGVIEILASAPIGCKKHGWSLWSAQADLSGYLLSDILALSDTETPEIAYGIVQAWIKQANLARCNHEQIGKMDKALTTRQDKIDLWTKWARQTDLTVYKLLDMAAIMARQLESVAVVMAQEWVKQGGNEARAQLKALRPNDETVKKIHKLNLPDEARNVWNRAAV